MPVFRGPWVSEGMREGRACVSCVARDSVGDRSPMSGQKQVTGVSIVASFTVAELTSFVLLPQPPALERVRSPLDDVVAAGPPGRFAPCLALPQGDCTLGPDPARPGDDCTIHVDVHQQVDQAAGPLYSVPGRCVLVARVHSIRLFPRRHQDVRGDDPQCGKLYYSTCPSAPPFPNGLLVGESMEKERKGGNGEITVLVAGNWPSSSPMTRQHRNALITTPPSCRAPSLTQCFFPCEPIFLMFFLIHTCPLIRLMPFPLATSTFDEHSSSKIPNR